MLIIESMVMCFGDREIDLIEPGLRIRQEADRVVFKRRFGFTEVTVPGRWEEIHWTARDQGLPVNFVGPKGSSGRVHVLVGSGPSIIERIKRM